MEHCSVLQVDLRALRENVQTLTGFLSPGSQLCAVIKADAYGLGAALAAARLEQWGVNWLAVYNLTQAGPVLNATTNAKVLVFVPVAELPAEFSVAAKSGRLHLTIHSLAQMDKLRSAARKMGVRLPVHVEVDTGMSRGGEPPEQASKTIAEILSSPEFSLAGVFTHLSSADSDQQCTEEQEKIFNSLIAQSELPANIVHHSANTWATLANNRYHHGMVRVGLGLWGYPSGQTWAPAERNGLRLRPVVRWVSKIVHTKNLPANTSVGYGRTFKTVRPTRVGIVPIGYADGYPLLLSSRGIVRVGPDLRPAPVLGRVNMDQLIIDLTDTPCAEVGGQAELISNDPTAPNAIHKLADLAQSHCYEMLCRISPRVPREYVD